MLHTGSPLSPRVQSAETPALLANWTVFPDGASYENTVTQEPVGPIQVTTAIVRQRAQKARAAGFRVSQHFIADHAARITTVYHDSFATGPTLLCRRAEHLHGCAIF